ncbi:DNA-binding protein RFX2-like, partial [Rhincodon typus]|uniref:DNA-binding protein RFX2-like n=1 Tax=Rhincodon typus TaxID=259920 RepID=UPI00202EC184
LTFTLCCPQRLVVQATGSAQKGGQVQQLQVQRVQQVQQVQSVQHVYPSQVQYVEGGDAVYTNGTMAHKVNQLRDHLCSEAKGRFYEEVDIAINRVQFRI